MQNDINNTNGTNPIGQPVNTVSPPSSIDDKVIESSRAILDGMPSQSVVSRPAPVQQPSQQIPRSNGSVPSVQTPISNNIVKKTAVFGAILIVVIGGFALIKNNLSGYGTKSFNNSGYTYAFTFYKSAHDVTLSDGSSADNYQDKVSAKGQPVSGAIETSCSKYEGTWKQAFTVQLGGRQYPVCSTSNKENYAVYFSSQNHNQLFMLTYNSPQSSSNNPTLKTIFDSIHVS